MRNLTEDNLTEAVLAKLAGAKDERFRTVMASLIRHMHAFVRDVELTEAEWRTAIDFLTATGKTCDDKRQEFILLSDTLGVSMLVDAINHRMPEGTTETTVLGPFHVEGAPELPLGSDISTGHAGIPTLVSGRVSNLAGKPLAGVQLDVWQTDHEGFYDVQRPELGLMRLRGRFRTDAQGRYHFRTIKPVSYPIPTDGPVGKMLMLMGRHPYRPAHIHFILTAPGFQPIVTHLFAEGDPYLDSDAVFGVKNSLVVDFKPYPAGLAPDGSRQDTPYCTVEYDFGLQPA